ncbi:hypothetical protein GCM10009801_18690 [Streptomyces albiaxialis]|uniref:Uncharacterized protein n=1 Tax=Streptomyces albiaxialis TaxID=329523 RepID=A0ABP5HC48_9ACTN
MRMIRAALVAAAATAAAGALLTANDRATSLLNTGTYAGGVNNVLVTQGANLKGLVGCVARGELYVDDLRNDKLRLGIFSTPANNKISAHTWVPRSGCLNPLT